MLWVALGHGLSLLGKEVGSLSLMIRHALGIFERYFRLSLYVMGFSVLALEISMLVMKEFMVFLRGVDVSRFCA